MAQAGQSQSTVVNLQVSSATTSGGSGSVSVANQTSTDIDRTGNSSSTSGLAIALTPNPTSPDPLTVASSGGASATGLQSQNVVTNSAQASVQVNGQNSGNIVVQSTNQVTIVEGAQANASSGNTLAAPQGTPVPTLSQISLPTITGAAGATSVDVSGTGLTANNQMQLRSEATAAAAPGPTTPTTLNQSQQVVIANAAGGVAVSGDASAVPTTTPAPTKVEPLTSSAPVPSATPVGDTAAATASLTPGGQTGGSLASSGAAEATGLIVQNSVNTSANVQVTVQGENRGLITVLIESITQIFNFGSAMAQSGDATAANGGSTTPISTVVPASPLVQATSGDANATGAKVTNDVDMNSTASVKVDGDNRTPINLVIDLFAWIGNAALGWAQSGDAQATGGTGTDQSSGGTIAQSGSAQATGLDASNHVNMSASALVDIDGSNYSDIFVRVRFHTYIWNQGEAYASSGKVASMGGSGTESSAGAQSVGGSTAPSGNGGGGDSGSNGSGSTGFQSSVARSGDANTEGHNSAVQIASAQYANGNGSGPGFNALLPTIINQLPDPQIPAVQESSLPADIEALANMFGDVNAQSGDATSYGLQTGDAELNAQISHAGNPGSNKATATNSFAYDNTMQGNSSAETGFAGVNATPIPTPNTQENGSQSGNGGANNGRSVRQTVESHLELYQASWIGGDLVAGNNQFHSLVKVNVPSRWPELQQLPMPGQKLSMPQLLAAAQPSAGRVASAAPVQPSSVSVDVNPMTGWPRLELPPMPGQSLKENQAGSAGPQFGVPGGGTRGPIEALVWSLAGMLALGAVVTKRGRAWMATWANSWARQMQAAARLFLGLILS